MTVKIATVVDSGDGPQGAANVPREPCRYRYVAVAFVHKYAQLGQSTMLMPIPVPRCHTQDIAPHIARWASTGPIGRAACCFATSRCRYVFTLPRHRRPAYLSRSMRTMRLRIMQPWRCAALSNGCRRCWPPAAGSEFAVRLNGATIDAMLPESRNSSSGRDRVLYQLRRSDACVIACARAIP